MDGGGCISLGGVSDTNIHFVLRLGSGIAINFLNMKSTRCTTMFSTFTILLLLVQISLAKNESPKKDDSPISQHPWINRTTPNMFRSLRDWVLNEEYRRNNMVSDYYSPLASCGDGKCDEGETVLNCPEDCKSYPEMELPAPSCMGLANGVHCYPDDCCGLLFICNNGFMYGKSQRTPHTCGTDCRSCDKSGNNLPLALHTNHRSAQMKNSHAQHHDQAIS